MSRAEGFGSTSLSNQIRCILNVDAVVGAGMEVASAEWSSSKRCVILKIPWTSCTFLFPQTFGSLLSEDGFRG